MSPCHAIRNKCLVGSSSSFTAGGAQTTRGPGRLEIADAHHSLLEERGREREAAGGC